MWYIYTKEYYLAIKKEETAICSNMDRPRDCHTEGSKSVTERQISYDITNLWNLKKGYKWSYLQNRSRVTDVENKFMFTKTQWEGG